MRVGPHLSQRSGDESVLLPVTTHPVGAGGQTGLTQSG